VGGDLDAKHDGPRGSAEGRMTMLGGVTWAASIASAADALGRSPSSGYLGLIGLGGVALAGSAFAAR